MSSWARVGVKCVFVDDMGIRFLELCPTVGGIYTIASVGNGFFGLDEIRHENGEPSRWSARRFRPLISQADDVAMFKGLVETMKPTERLDALRELLDTTPS